MTTTTQLAQALHIRMPADIGGLEIARLQMAQFLERHTVDERSVAAAELLLEEVVTNVLRHGYDGSGGLHWIEIDVEATADAVRLVVVDDARPFDPLSVAEPELPVSLDDARVGGLGLLMIRSTASSVSYERREGRNRLSLSIDRADDGLQG